MKSYNFPMKSYKSQWNPRNSQWNPTNPNENPTNPWDTQQNLHWMAGLESLTIGSLQSDSPLPGGVNGMHPDPPKLWPMDPRNCGRFNLRGWTHTKTYQKTWKNLLGFVSSRCFPLVSHDIHHQKKRVWPWLVWLKGSLCHGQHHRTWGRTWGFWFVVIFHRSQGVLYGANKCWKQSKGNALIMFGENWWFGIVMNVIWQCHHGRQAIFCKFGEFNPMWCGRCSGRYLEASSPLKKSGKIRGPFLGFVTCECQKMY